MEAGDLDIVRFLLAHSPPPEINIQRMHASEYAAGARACGAGAGVEGRHEETRAVAEARKAATA